MNNTIKIAIGTALGAGIGYFVGSVIVEIIASKQFDESLELEDIPVREEKKVKEKQMGQSKKKYEKLFEQSERPELVQLIKHYNGDESVEDDGLSQGLIQDAIEDEFDLEDADEPKDITIIDVAEYANNNRGYDEITLLYFDDDTVTDDQNIPITKPEELIGEEALVSFGELSNDPDTVYVRNDIKRAVYEVIRKNMPYINNQPRRRTPLSKRRDQEGDNHGEENSTN